MKKGVGILVLLLMATVCFAQEEQVILLADFEESNDSFSYSYTGGGVIESAVFFPGENDPQPYEGQSALYISYSHANPYPWSWNQINFATPLDLTGMREIHMWVYFVPGATGDLSIRLDVGGGSLGTQTAPSAGEWHELIWPIDRLTSDTRLSEVGSLGGFLQPGSAGATGELWIDYITAVRPAGIPEIETILVDSFEEEDPDTGAPLGWGVVNGVEVLRGSGEVDASDGDYYLECYLAGGWVENFRNFNAMEVFDRWTDVVEIMIDARQSAEYTGSWVQSDLILHSGVTDGEGIENVNGWDGKGQEIGFSGTTDSWKTLLWSVDMSRHAGAFENEGGWFYVSFSINNDPSQEGARVFYDNFRVSVPKTTDVGGWSLY